MASPVPRTVTQYPAGEPAVYVAPDFQTVGVDALISNSATVASLQAQINDLVARVTALENASGGAAG